MAQPTPLPENDLSTVPFPTALQKHKTIRQSLLASFESCALETKLDMEYRSGWSGHPQGRGTIFHRMAAKALLWMAQHEENQIPTEEALEILRECLRQHDVPPDDVVNVPFKEIKDLRWVTVKWASENVFDVKSLASIEERLYADVAYPDGNGGNVIRRLTGQLDAVFAPVDDHAVVVDWKDTWALPRESEVSDKGYFQQRFYAMLIMVRYPAIQRVTLRETYVRLKDEVTETAPVREATVFRSELDAILEEMAGLAERFDRAVEHGKWPLEVDPQTGKPERPELWTPSPGSHCSYCPRPTACPIFPDARVQGAIQSEEQAKLWAGQKIVAAAAEKQRDAALRAWADAHGPIPVKSAKEQKVMGYKAAKRTSRPKESEVRRFLRENPHGDISELYRTSTITRFSQHTEIPGVTDVEPTADDIPLTQALEESLKQQREAYEKDPENNPKPYDPEDPDAAPF